MKRDEYICENMGEHKYLNSMGIRYEFVKKVNGMTQYKYLKTERLFKALAKYWSENIGGEKYARKK